MWTVGGGGRGEKELQKNPLYSQRNPLSSPNLSPFVLLLFLKYLLPLPNYHYNLSTQRDENFLKISQKKKWKRGRTEQIIISKNLSTTDLKKKKEIITENVHLSICLATNSLALAHFWHGLDASNLLKNVLPMCGVADINDWKIISDYMRLLFAIW